MSTRRRFVNDLKGVLSAIYNDFMNEVKLQDPDEVFDWVNNEIEVDMMITKDGSTIIQGICNRDVGYIKRGIYWEIKNYNLLGYFRSDWIDFVEDMIEHCVYFNAGR
jgi:hypothetical protein